MAVGLEPRRLTPEAGATAGKGVAASPLPCASLTMPQSLSGCTCRIHARASEWQGATHAWGGNRPPYQGQWPGSSDAGKYPGLIEHTF